MTFRLLDDLGDSSEFVSSSFRQHKPTVASRLGLKWATLGDSSEIAGHVTAMIDLMDQDLAQGREDLEDAGHEHQFELDGDKEMLIERDEAAAALASRYIQTRDLYIITYGKVAARKVGFEPKVAQNPRRLRRQVKHLLRSLPKRTAPEPAAEAVLVAPLDHERIVEILTPYYTRLRKALGEVVKEGRAAEPTLIAKNEALARHTREFSNVARCGEMLYRMAGMPEEAARVRPSVRRPGRRAEDDGALDPTPTNPDTEPPVDSDQPTDGGTPSDDSGTPVADTPSDDSGPPSDDTPSDSTPPDDSGRPADSDPAGDSTP